MTTTINGPAGGGLAALVLRFAVVYAAASRGADATADTADLDGVVDEDGPGVVTVPVTRAVSLSVDSRTGRYTVTGPGGVWLVGVPPTIAGAPNSLALTPGSVNRSTGTDRQGRYDSISLGWSSSMTSPRAVKATHPGEERDGPATPRPRASGRGGAIPHAHNMFILRNH